MIYRKEIRRVHKSYIINIDKVERFNSKFAEIGITKIPLSRNKKRFSKSTFLCVKNFNKIDIYTNSNRSVLSN
jgi:hypothetical protein